MILSTFKKPYYAVIFSSSRSVAHEEDYEKMAERMLELSRQQNGFLGVESLRNSDGVGITISYWDSEESIQKWKSHSEHLIAQELGRSQWYDSFTIRICKIERDYDYQKGAHV